MYISVMKDGDRMPEKARFIVSKASAGSGKTFQLVLIYLTLALSVDDSLSETDKRKKLEDRFSQILAITFTNAAVNEMKQRILTELDALCDDKAEKRPLMEQKLCETTGLEPDVLRQRAKIVYNAILHHYSDLAVCTIDSFANRIVKTFAHDMNLPQNFDISLDENELIDKVSDNIMALVGTEGEEELSSLLYTYSEEKMEEDSGYNIEDKLKKIIPFVMRENAPEYIAKLNDWTLNDYRRLRKEFVAANKLFEATLEAKANEGLDLIKQNNIEESMFYQGASSAPVYFRNILNKKYVEPNKYAKSFFEGDKIEKGGCNSTTKQAIISIKPRLVELYNEIEAVKERELKKYHSRKRLMDNLYEIGLMKRISNAMEQYYDENDLLHISEINKRIAKVVGNGEDAPFIYERIGNRYHNILIDEFQDTSRQQWRNLVPLVDNSVSEGHTSLVVGDGKQAIYRFREGDVRQFSNLPHVEGCRSLNIENPQIYTPFPKKDNWRSRPEVVYFNNNYFSYVVSNGYSDNEYLRDIYIGERLDGEDDLVQHCKADTSKPLGFVKLTFSKKNDELWEQIADEVEHQHQLGFDYEEICVLAPKHKYLSRVSDILISRGVKIMSKESLRLENSHLVRLVLETLRCLHTPTDRCATLNALMELENIGTIDQSFRQQMMNSDGATTLPQILHTFGIDFEPLENLSLYDLSETLLRLYNPGGYENGYATKLLNIVAEYSRLHRQDLGEFLQWMDSHLNEMSLSVSSPDAVPLQTIHTAKGLQWPVVIVALPQMSGNNDRKVWVEVGDKSLGLPVGLVTPTSSVSTLFDEQFNDERKLSEMDITNMVYVAMTRPEQKLIVYATCSDASKGAPSHQKFLARFAEDYINSDICSSSIKSKSQNEHGVQYTFGNDHNKTTDDKTKTADSPFTISDISFPNYNERIEYAHHANEKRQAGVEREFGNMLHEILASINSTDDIEPTLKRYSKRNRLPNEVLSVVRQRLENTVNGEASSRFFKPGLKVCNEAPLQFNGEELRPDRIVFMDNETWVVDFKTGTPHENHKAQVRKYCAAIEAMGYPTVSGHLLYLKETGCEVMDV